MNILSRNDAKERGAVRYFTGKPCKRGHIAERHVSSYGCVLCANEDLIRYRAEDPEKAKAAFNLQRRIRYHQDIESSRKKAKEKRLSNPEKRRELDRKWAARNREKTRASARAYDAAHPKERNAEDAKRRACQINRTPPWADLAAIKQFYKNCPCGYHVDHIIPLQAELASGLHVLLNLQYLPAIENLLKGNTFIPC